MKIAAVGALLFVAHTLKWDRLKVPPSARGEIN